MASHLEDEREIQKVITRMVHCLDRRSWSEFRNCFADLFGSDYTSIFGGEPEEMKADDLVTRLRGSLGRLDATMHLLGPIDVEVKGKEAAAECHLYAYHRLERAPSGNELVLGGHYIFGFVKEDAGWKIRKMTLELLYHTGNMKMLQELDP